MKIVLSVACLFIASFSLLIFNGECQASKKAVAIILGETKIKTGGISKISGTIRFFESASNTQVMVMINGVPPNGMQHGLHVHEFGITVDTQNITERCLSTGPHYNPFAQNHGGLNTSVRHIGDFGNINCNNQGVCNGNFSVPTINLSGDFSVLGRAIVLHQNRDDLGLGGNASSLENGNSGARIACGVIGIDKP